MENLEENFIKYALHNKVLQFGDFTLKSGRKSPYFFNMGNIYQGDAINNLGLCYAKKIIDANLDCDIVFGPAYKGIPLATATVMQLKNAFNKNASYTFNRKEQKDHGEGGTLIGANLNGNVVIVDDVITKGTAIREALKLILNSKAKITGIVIALDRQEKGTNNISAIEQIEKDYDVPVYPIIKANDIFEYAQKELALDTAKKIKQYQDEYCL